MKSRAGKWTGYAFVAPATLYLVAFSFLPMVVAAYLSLHRWHLLKEDKPFIGLNNYTQLAGDPFFQNALYNSVLFVLFSVPIGLVTSLAVALLVAQSLRGMAVFRTLFFVPGVCSVVALSMVWIWICLPEVGFINVCLRLLGFEGSTDVLNDTRWALLSLALMSAWIGLGPRMVVFVAGLQGIPVSLYQAADLDGCTGWRRFWHMTLPLLRPTTLFVLVTSTIAAFQWFTPVYVITRGGPRRSTDVVAYHIFKEAWQKFEIGMASAQTYVLFALVLAVAVIQFRLLRLGWRPVGAE